MKNKLFLLIALLTVTIVNKSMWAQNMITGKVKEANASAVEYASALLLNGKDGSLAKGAFTDPQGKFEFENVKPGTYQIKISFTGKKDILIPAFDYPGGLKDIGDQSFIEVATELKAVTVTAIKPVIEIKAEKLILNVENNVSSTGSDGLELLRKAPGVVIDNNENITLKGKNGVQIYIDGKPTRLSGNDLASLLKSYNANNIEAIEVIQNPSAKYEAEGNAGIINIRLKRNQSLGTNGNLAANFRMGISPKGGLSLNLNHRSEKFNFYTNVSSNIGIYHENLDFYREQGGLFFDQQSRNKSDSVKYPSLNYRFGVDYVLNSKSTIGAQWNGRVYDGVDGNFSRTLIGTLRNNGQIDSVLNAHTRDQEHRRNNQFNLNYAYKDTAGRTFNLDADYGFINRKDDTYNPNLYMSPNEASVYSTSIFSSLTNTDITIKTIKGDYEQNLAKGRLGLGFKVSDISTDNLFDFFDYVNGIKTMNRDKSNQFTYDETIYAAYSNFTTKYKKFDLQAGLRLESTNSHGRLLTMSNSNDDDVKRTYTDLFPSLALTYNINKKHTLGINYSRRIDRPRYQNLNPFEQRLDELTFRKGNPFLKPQYSNNLSINHTYMGMITTSLSYSRTNDFFGQIIDSTQRKRTFITEKNIAKVDNYGIGISAPLPLAKWYNGFISANYFYQVYDADFGNKTLHIGTGGFNMYSEHTATLKNGIKLQISGWYNKGGVWGGTFVNQGMGSLDLGIQKTIWDKQADIKISITDVLKTAAWNGVSDFGGVYFRGHGYNESQTVRVNFNYRFGNLKVKAARNRKTGLEDEQRRAGN